MNKYKERLHNEILVDCRDEYEQNMSWFYYAEEHIQFPFSADIRLKKSDGKEEIKRIQVEKLTTDDSDFEHNFDLKIAVDVGGYLIEIPLSKLENIEAEEETIEIIDTWKYWRKR